MTGNNTSFLFDIAAAAAAVAAASIATNVRADDITMDNSQFVSSKSRDEVRADLKKPYPGGNPWSSSYKMGVTKSDRTREEVRREYLGSREEARALTAEDSGASYFNRTAGRANPTATMGAPAR